MISCPKASHVQHLDKYNSELICKALGWVVASLSPPALFPNTHPGVKLEIMISEVFSNVMGSVILCPPLTGSQSFPRAGSIWSLTGLGSAHKAHGPLHGHVPWVQTQLPGSDHIYPKPFGPMLVTVFPHSTEPALTLSVLGSGQGGVAGSQQRLPRIRPRLTRKRKCDAGGKGRDAGITG